MRHYEQSGQFGRAENELFTIVEAQPTGQSLLEFGESFYHRILNHSDATLDAGNLSRAEAEVGLADFRSKLKGV